MTEEKWTGRPEDTPSRDERERKMYELLDEFEGRKHGFDFGDRLVVRAIRPLYLPPPRSPEEQEACRLANELGPRLLSDSWSEENKEWERRHPVD